MENNFYSLRTERHFLGGILKFPEVFPEIDSTISEFDFFNLLHSTIFCVVRGCFLKHEKFDKVSLAQKIKNLNIRFDDDLEIFSYIEDLFFTQITKDGAINAGKQLSTLRIRREIYDVAAKIQTKTKEFNGESIDVLISECDQIYNEKITKFVSDNQSEDLFAGMPDIIEERGRNPVVETGLVTPYKEFNRLFGGIRAQNIYAFVSRAGVGKSTILNDLAFQVCVINNSCRALVLDTEMNSLDVKFRLASALTDIPTWYLETGRYTENEQYRKSLEDKKEQFKKFRGLIDHIHVPAKKISEIESIVRKWYYGKCGRGSPAIVVYDYIKLTGEANGGKEWEIIGNKVNSLKELSSSLNIPILTACQLNRSAEQGIDDSSAIALSDRLLWYASFVAIFRRKTVEEILDDGPAWGSHKLIPLKTRFQGRDSQGHQDLIRVPNGSGKFKYVKNFLNYDVKNFKVTELGGLRDILKSQANIHHVQDDNSFDSSLI
ncbi:MAG: DnaB-like helicase C-terminal domain-containing protein [Nanoarchaeota archaeon]